MFVSLKTSPKILWYDTIVSLNFVCTSIFYIEKVDDKPWAVSFFTLNFVLEKQNFWLNYEEDTYLICFRRLSFLILFFTKKIF